MIKNRELKTTKRGCGGMVDAADLKSVEPYKLVRVQVSLPPYFKISKLFSWLKFESQCCQMGAVIITCYCSEFFSFQVAYSALASRVFRYISSVFAANRCQVKFRCTFSSPALPIVLAKPVSSSS
jgi:hypothetical protein